MNNFEPKELWNQIIECLRPDLGNDNVELWLKPSEPVRFQEGVLTIRVPNRFFCEWIKEHYHRRIQEVLRTLTNQDVQIDYDISHKTDSASRAASHEVQPLKKSLPEAEFPQSFLNPRYTFENFVVGTCNRFAYSMAEHISKNPGKQYNPFFVYGGVGLGKTHLIQAIGAAMRKEHPRVRIVYLTSEDFVNEYINSLRYDKVDSFRSKYRNLDCLLMDDIQFLIGKGRSEEEFFHTFNSLFESYRQIVVASDRAPKEMSPSEQRLISRFEWGVVADVKPPDRETRIAILRTKAEAEGVFVPEDVIQYIAQEIKTSIRELEGALTRVCAHASLGSQLATVDLAKEILKDMIPAERPSEISVEAIQKVVSEKYSLGPADLKSKRRTDAIALPRQIAMYLTHELTDLSTPSIGDAFGGRDHSTVIHATKKIRGMLEKDPFFSELINNIMEKIRSVENV